jgi:hypothetical protein
MPIGFSARSPSCPIRRRVTPAPGLGRTTVFLDRESRAEASSPVSVQAHQEGSGQMSPRLITIVHSRKRSQSTAALFVAVIGNSTVRKGGNITMDCFLLLFRIQRECPRREGRVEGRLIGGRI